MGIYDDLGLRTVINASGTLTRLGGSRMAPEVLAAMAEAAASFVPIDALQARAGEIIAEVTGAESGYVVTGAAAGLSLGVAACVAGFNVAAMDRLPDTTGLRNEVVVQRGHRNAYDHAIRAVGVRMVEVGYLGYPGAGGTYPWQIADAISDRTAAIACPILDTPGTVPLREVCAIAHEHGLPVIVDAAAELPPRSNLRRFIAEGADLVVFSGGKAIGGPQASGMLAGRADLIASVALQHQDMDVRDATWSQRDLLANGVLRGVPHQGFGRSMKVGREEIVGLLVALQRFAAGSPLFRCVPGKPAPIDPQHILTIADCAQDLAGAPLDNAPEWSVAVFAQWEQPLPRGAVWWSVRSNFNAKAQRHKDAREHEKPLESLCLRVLVLKPVTNQNA